MNDPGPITELLQSVRAGDRQASEQLLPLVYDQLRQLAHARMASESPQTLQPTALVHEAYLRLVAGENIAWDSRGHFFAAAAEAMRRILVERARRVAAKRHGGGLRRVDLSDPGAFESPETLLGLDEALTRLAGVHPRLARVVMLKFFGGLTLDEIALALDKTVRTVSRDWVAARAYLYRELSADT